MAVPLLAFIMAGCAAFSAPENRRLELFDPEKSTAAGPAWRPEGPSFVGAACPPAGTQGFLLQTSGAMRRSVRRSQPMRYSPGDRFNLTVFQSPEFSGDFAVNADGVVVLPFAGEVDAVGMTNGELATAIRRALIKSRVLTADGAQITVRPVQYGPINVSVAGAVFLPGRYAIGGIKDSDKSDRVLQKFGDSPMERFVAAALRAAGGVRPDADLARVVLWRNGRSYKLDWRGAVLGANVEDMPLIDGDHLQVEEAGCFQSALVRPSQITPPGVRIFTSNLTLPALSNAASVHNAQNSGNVPYGTRLLQGAVQANCVGGTLTTNARRYVVLISRNPKTLETEVVQRSIEELVRSADRDTINPFLMPDDAIACYDSTATELKDVLGLVQAMVLPANTLRGAIGR